jgi:hypothetical protein
MSQGVSRRILPPQKDGGAMSIRRRLAHHPFRNLHGAGSANPVPCAWDARRALNSH